MKRFSSTTLKTAFVKSIPIFCSYVFVSMAYGMMMASAGFPWYDSLLVSLTVYTGAFQFVLIKFLSSGASLITIALTALLMNSRQSFYSITFLKEFKQMGRRKLYMIHTMTDETYAVNCTLDLPKKEKEDTMFLVALFSRCYWIVGSVLGGILGQIIPFDLTGLDFCMTALFLIIFIDQWEKAEKHTPALTGLGTGVICLLIFGENRFMLPALLIVSALLLLFQRKENLA
ncbi:AzlC family ABC transporter permease [Fusicatenibacter saccharivorans]|uniref:AzlC family ABC transporter permease n=1 Tax=Fusicatenibacter saccharivorans TaxID=1150298 RepID=UPI00305F8385|nr:AzlC family ABC transporter permease [Fusicatenibacter saccharivorans]